MEGTAHFYHHDSQPTLLLPEGERHPPLLNFVPKDPSLPSVLHLAPPASGHRYPWIYIRADQLSANVSSVRSMRIREYMRSYRQAIYVEPITVCGNVMDHGPHRAVAALQLGAEYMLAISHSVAEISAAALAIQRVSIDFLPQVVPEFSRGISWADDLRERLRRIFNDRAIRFADYLFKGIPETELEIWLATGAGPDGNIGARPIQEAKEEFRLRYLVIYDRAAFESEKPLEALRYILDLATGEVKLPSL